MGFLEDIKNLDYFQFDQFNKNHPGFYPSATCSICKKKFQFRYSHSRDGKEYSCSDCGNVLSIAFDHGLFFIYDIEDWGSRNQEEILAIILKNMKPCICGGHFCSNKIVRCPHCKEEIDKTPFLLHFYFKEHGDSIFVNHSVGVLFHKEVDSKAKKDNYEFRHETETLMEFFHQGKLKEMSVEMKNDLAKKKLPIYNALIILAGKWVIDSPSEEFKGLFKIQKKYP